MSLTADLRGRAAALGQTLPPLLAAADHLAQAVILGDHGRRRAGDQRAIRMSQGGWSRN